MRKATAISALCSCYVGYPRLAGSHHAASRSALRRGQDISERLPPKGPRRYPYCKRHIDCIVPKEIASFVVPEGLSKSNSTLFPEENEMFYYMAVLKEKLIHKIDSSGF